jgi:hypothetical protein
MITMSCVTAAQTLQFFPSAAAPAITHKFAGVTSADTEAFTFTNTAVHLSDYNTIQVTVSAPPGLAWHVPASSHGPTVQDVPYLSLNLTCLTPGQAMAAPFAQITSGSLDLNFVLGGETLLSAPSVSGFIPASGNSFSIEGTVGVNGNVAFTSLTLTVHFENSLLAPAPLEPASGSMLRFEYYGFTSDPGPQLTLIPIPVPTPLLWQTVHFPDASDVLVFSWTNSNFSLQAGPTPTGVFTNVPGGTSPYAISAKAFQLFFRLQAN